MTFRSEGELKMKNLFKIAALSLCTALTCAACVQENPSVSLNGVLNPRKSDCTSADSAENFLVVLTYDASKTSAYRSWINVSNNMTTDSPWTSSGSSSSGATLDVENPNINTVYIDKLYAKCVSLDGEEDACNGKETYKQNVGNTMLIAGGTANIPFSLSADALGWGKFKEAEIKLTAHYHDNGVLSGSNYETSSFIVKLIDSSQLDPTDAYYDSYGVIEQCLAKDNATLTPPSEDCSYMYQDGSAGWECEEEEKEEENSGGE